MRETQQQNRALLEDFSRKMVKGWIIRKLFYMLKCGMYT